MNSQAALLKVKQGVVAPESVLWRHAAVRPLADHESPLAVHQRPPASGHEFTGVRVHSDAQAAESARALNGMAYLAGRDVVFGAAMPGSLSDAGEAFIVHHSPPTAGPGSRVEPLAHRRSIQPVSSMRSDAYYRSPANPTNPVLVWTDGSTLFFSPAQAQVTGRRATPMPEPSLSAPPGYVAAELRWDRDAVATGGAPLVVVARKARAPDIHIIIWNNLEQTASVTGQGLTATAQTHVSRAGTEFVRVDDLKVSLEFSGAAARGEIHRTNFPDGYFRYRARGGDHDLYIAQGASPFGYLVERTSGRIVQRFTAGTIAMVAPQRSGVVSLELTTTRGATTPSTTTIDLRSSPPTVTSAAGHATAEAGYADAKARLEAVGVTFREAGVRMTVGELAAIEQALTIGGRRGLDALLNFRRLIGGSTRDPILEVSKAIGVEYGGGLAGVSSGTPALFVNEPFADSPTGRVATVRHEMTHIIMGATDAVRRSRLSTSERARLEGALRFEAGHASAKARAGLLHAGEYGAAEAQPASGTQRDWRSLVGEDVELANVWVELLPRYTFIPDPEGTRELRGTSLADESRYTGGAERTGHPADSVGEFVASFVTSATLFRTQFVAAVLAAETAGSVRGSGGSYLRGRYRRAWSLIDSRYVPLGANPF